jgi:hypothetical protein
MSAPKKQKSNSGAAIARGTNANKDENDESNSHVGTFDVAALPANLFGVTCKFLDARSIVEVERTCTAWLVASKGDYGVWSVQLAKFCRTYEAGSTEGMSWQDHESAVNEKIETQRAALNAAGRIVWQGPTRSTLNFDAEYVDPRHSIDAWAGLTARQRYARLRAHVSHVHARIHHEPDESERAFITEMAHGVSDEFADFYPDYEHSFTDEELEKAAGLLTFERTQDTLIAMVESDFSGYGIEGELVCHVMQRGWKDLLILGVSDRRGFNRSMCIELFYDELLGSTPRGPSRDREY